MGKNILIIAVIVVGAYLLGAQSAKRTRKDYEDLRHQLERLWTSPEARKSRKRMAKKTQRMVDDVIGNAQKTYRKITH